MTKMLVESTLLSNGLASFGTRLVANLIDLRYSDYSEKLKAIFRDVKHVSVYQSENLMNYTIEKILGLPGYRSFKHALHIPLRSIIRDNGQLTDEERKYVANIWTHVDFLIYNRLDMSPVLVIEVDGVAFHENNPKQLERDRLKDRILEKHNIPILRIRTNESAEEARLICLLDRVMHTEAVPLNSKDGDHD